MAAFDPATLDRWRELAIVDRDGTTVGTISEFYLDRETGYPTWALVNTGLFGATQTFVPLVHATEISDGLQVPYQKNHIKDTPRIDLHDELTPEEEADLFTHYGVEYHPSPDVEPAGPAGTAEAGSGEAEAGSGSGEAGSGASLSPVAEASGSASPSPVTATTLPTGEGPGPVPAEPGSIPPPETAAAEVTPTDATTGAVPAGPETDDAAASQHDPTADTAIAAVPDEPGTTEAFDAHQTESPRSGSHRLDTDELERSEGGSGPEPHELLPDPAQPTPADLQDSADPSGDPPPDFQEGDRPQAAPPSSALSQSDPDLDSDLSPQSAARDLDVDRTEAAPPHSNPDPSGSTPADPGLARTAPVEPGLPGSTAAAPYEPGPTTIDKGDASSGASAEAPPTEHGETGWVPGAAGSFEEQEPYDRQMGASDRWREAKLAAERDRIARTAAAQPEERSPLERARRRLERLVGVGQDPDPDEISPTDREAAERARRARLGLDEDDPHRR
jgi:hypothetical protein